MRVVGTRTVLGIVLSTFICNTVLCPHTMLCGIRCNYLYFIHIETEVPTWHSLNLDTMGYEKMQS